MSIDDMKKEDLELLSYKDITNIILGEKGPKNTKDLFQIITTLLELPTSIFETKIGDYYTMLSTDKRFILLENGEWDLKERYASNRVAILTDDDDDDAIELEEDVVDVATDDDKTVEDDYDSASDDDYDDSEDDLKGLVIVDEEELELED